MPTKIDFEIRYRPHPGQREVHRSKARFRVLCAGRRSGKTTAAAAECLAACLNPAGKQVVAWAAPEYRHTKLLVDTLARMIKPDPRVVRHHKADREFRFATGSTLRIFSLDNPTAILGSAFDLIVLDEMAEVGDPDIWDRIIRPTLADHGGRALFISTPLVKSGTFWDMFQRGMSPDDSEVESFHMPTAANPHIAPEEVEAYRQSVPGIVFEQQFEARFLDDGGSVFSNLGAAVARYEFPEDPIPGEAYACGIDLAKGGSSGSDWTVVAVLRRIRGKDGKAKARLAAIERWRGESWAAQMGRIKTIYDKYHQPYPTYLDATGMGDPVSETLRLQYGIGHTPIVFTNLAKAAMVNQLRMGFEQETLELPPARATPAVQALVRELAIYSSKPLPGGTIRFEAPTGQHDDLVTSLMLSYSAVQYAGADMVTLI